MSVAHTARKPHRVLVIGAGSIGERHLRCFLSGGRATLAFVEPHDARRNEVAARYPSAKAFADLDAALAWGINAAVVATPAPLHIPMATRLAEGGSHLLIEKPLALSLDGVETLESVVRRRGLVAAVAYVHRAHPALSAMREAVRSGRFGRVLEVVAVSGQNFPHYRPAYRQTYYADRKTGGGAIQDALTHTIDTGQFLAGRIDRVVADAAHQALEDVDVEDTVHVLARHGAAMGSYALNQHQAPNESTITVICANGTARFESHHGRWRWTMHPDEPWQDESFAPIERDTLFVRQADAFLDSIEGKRPPLCPLEDGIAALKVNLAILASVERRAWQEVA
jgi:predicted dehydrogenase